MKTTNKGRKKNTDEGRKEKKRRWVESWRRVRIECRRKKDDKNK